MKRLIEKTVLVGLVIAWRLATWPTSRSPVFVNATTEGVVRVPSEFEITTGSPPSITATHELVVPRSIPMVLPIVPPMAKRGEACASPRPLAFFRRRSESDRSLRLRPLRGLDGDLAGLGLLGLWNAHFEHTVAIGRGDALRLNRMGQREGPLELAVHALRTDEISVLLLFLAPLLAANDELVVGERDLDVL